MGGQRTGVQRPRADVGEEAEPITRGRHFTLDKIFSTPVFTVSLGGLCFYPNFTEKES